MAFILPKGVIKEVEKRLQAFLWKGHSNEGYPKVAWNLVCRPIEEGGQGIRDLHALNRALMSHHLWNTLLNHIEFKIGNGDSLSLWHDPWHSLGPLISRFSWGPSILQLPETSKLSSVIIEGDWHWPPITAMECNEIIHNLPHTCRGNDLITWRPTGGEFNTATAYDVFYPSGLKVGWSSLLLGWFKTPPLFWLSILEKLSTMDKPWLARLGGECVLCHHEMETHDHLFFKCIYSRQCLHGLKRAVRFYWRNHSWVSDVIWVARK
ncbi:UNVERIFIED_CONTAM: hypothetical protein Slati_3554800 [Sesamum latifolium]|uniref:Reverse transcriptase zinc-binding domain-containing protein n=1 Tax=Sesamum latifolium TaxID=2727402 RepID=A0AAW2UJM4_9LAMI